MPKDFLLVAKDGIKIECHKTILGMRSKVLAGMFSSDGWKEVKEGEMLINESATVVGVSAQKCKELTLPY